MNAKRIYAAAIVGVALLALAGTTQASGRFSVRSLRGTYAFSGAGTLQMGTVQAGVVGLNSFDGAGRCDVTARLNAGGMVQTLTAARCSYRVNADGTGSLAVKFNEPPFSAFEFRSDFVLVDSSEVHFVLSDEAHGTVATGVAKKRTGPERD